MTQQQHRDDAFDAAVAEVRGRRAQTDLQRRATEHVDREEQAAKHREHGNALLSLLSAGTIAYSPSEGHEAIASKLRGAGFGHLLPPPRETPGARQVDPDADPLTALTTEERADVEKDPKLKLRFLDRIASAEAAVTAERERQANLEAIWDVHDARDRVDALADKAAAERAAARSK